MINLLVIWVPLLLIAHTYFFYPVLLYLWRSLRHAQVRPQIGELPFVSIAVAAYNEESCLESRIRNLKELDYPSECIEFLFGSDGSTDRTNQILLDHHAGNIHSFVWSERRGKPAVLNDLIARARGDIVILSDANTHYVPETARKLVQHFHDPSVGAVTGELVLQTQSATVGAYGEASYWTYENRLRRMESDIRTTLGATGAVYAIRKALYSPLPTGTSVVDDFLIPLRILKQGYNIRYEPDAIAYEHTSGSVAGEFRRKIRIGASNFQGISEFAKLLSPRYGFVSFALWSHKLIRWFAPLLLLLIFVGTCAQAFSSLAFGVFFVAQLGFLALVCLGFIADRLKIEVGILGFPYYFIAMNMALLGGFLKFLFKRQGPTWNVIR